MDSAKRLNEDLDGHRSVEDYLKCKNLQFLMTYRQVIAKKSCRKICNKSW